MMTATQRPSTAQSARNLRAMPEIDLYRIALVILIVGYCWLFFSLAVEIHAGMRTHKADLGQIDQAVWNSSRGRFLEQTDNGYIATRLTDHVEPILVLISPVFWLWNDVRALLLLQVISVAVGAWFLYEIALLQFDKLLSPRARQQIWEREPLVALARPLALALAAAYVLTPQLQSALLTEFHAAPLAVPLILWAFWAVEGERWRQLGAAVLLTALVKEEMALLAAGLGAWALWRIWWTHHTAPPVSNPRQGILIAVTVTLFSLIWFFIATFVIVPAHAADVYGVAESGYFQRYGALGDSPLDIFRSFFTQPQLVWAIATEPARLNYLFLLLAPVGLLALLAPEIVLLSLPLLLANLLSAYPAQYYGEFHYSAPLVPYIAVAAAFGVGRLWRWIARRTERSSAGFQHMAAAGAGTMAAASLWTNARTAIRPLLTWALVLWVLGWAVMTYRHHGRGPLGARYDPTPITAHHRLLGRFVAQIPADAAVTATAAVHPHVSHRRYIYQFPMGLEETEVDLGNADWALLDVTTNTDMAPGDVKSTVEAMLTSGWGVVDAADGFLLLQKGSGRPEIPAPFYDFVRAEPDLPTASVPGGLRLHAAGIDDWPRWRQTKITGLWQAPNDGSTIDPDAVDLFVRTPAGEPVTSLAAVKPPALVWYPPEQWLPGEFVRLTSLPLYLPREFGLTAATDVVAVDGRTSAGSDGHSWLQGWSRGTNDRLDVIPATAVRAADPETAPAPGRHRPQTEARFVTDDGATLELTAQVPLPMVQPDRPLDLHLRWHGASSWPAGWTVFVHLRQGTETVAQQDGMPRFFVPFDPNPLLAANGSANDRRQLTLTWEQLTAPDASGAPLTLVVGLYNPTTGARAAVVDRAGLTVGNEVMLGEIAVEPPPVPDQTCALIPQSCPAQWQK